MPEVEDGDLQEQTAIGNRLIGDECKMRYDALLAHHKATVATVTGVPQ